MTFYYFCFVGINKKGVVKKGGAQLKYWGMKNFLKNITWDPQLAQVGLPPLEIKILFEREKMSPLVLLN